MWLGNLKMEFHGAPYFKIRIVIYRDNLCLIEKLLKKMNSFFYKIYKDNS